MSARETLRQFKRLSPDQKALIKKKKYQGTKTIPEWIEFLAKPCKIDRKSEEVAKFYGNITLGLLIAAAITLPAAHYLTPYLFIATGVLGLVAIIFFIQQRRFKRLQVRNHLRTVLLPMLILLKEDVKSNHTVSLQLDLTKLKTPARMIKHIRPTSKYYPKIETRIFQAPWLIGRLKLMDGTGFKWQVDEALRVRRITKRGRVSGKIKTKLKKKTKHTLDLRASFPKANFKRKPYSERGVQYSESASHHVVRLKLKARGTGESDLPVSFVLQGFSNAYKLMEPCQ